VSAGRRGGNLADVGTFTVGAILREPEPVVRRFIDWYLSQGARRIVLFLDDPADPVLPVLAEIPQVEAVSCTPAFWAGLEMAPDTRFPRRQNAALTSAYRALRDGWFLNVDGDEIMRFEGRTIAEAVAGFPDVPSVRVQPAEEVWLADGAQAFRVPLARPAVSRVYGDQARLLRRRLGLVGHTQGKSFHRAGQAGLWLRQHWAVDAEGREVPTHVLGHADGAHLLHLSAQDYSAWRAKLDWRLSSANFSNHVRLTLEELLATEADPETACRRMWEWLHVLTLAQEAALEAEGGLLRVHLPTAFEHAADPVRV
jgi:hypothetical protein